MRVFDQNRFVHSGFIFRELALIAIILTSASIAGLLLRNAIWPQYSAWDGFNRLDLQIEWAIALVGIPLFGMLARLIARGRFIFVLQVVIITLTIFFSDTAGYTAMRLINR